MKKLISGKNALTTYRMRLRATAFASAFSVFALMSMTACSSKQGVENSSAEVSESDVSAEEDAILNDGQSVTAQDMGASDESMESAYGESSENFSKPVWKGSLKSTYSPGMTEWVVSRGESLSLIAAAVYGKARDWKKLAALNPSLQDPNIFTIGQKLRLPSSENSTEQLAQQEEAPATTPVSNEKPQDTQNTETTQTPTETPAPSTSTVVAEAPPAAVAVTAPTDTVNTAAPTDAAAPVDASMGVVSNDQVPPAGSAQVDQAAQAAGGGESNKLVKRVATSNKKMGLRNMLLGVAGFFLLLSGVIFILSKKKAKAANPAQPS